MEKRRLLEKFIGCILGAVIGDVIGAVVEAESHEYIKKKYRRIEDILLENYVSDFFDVWKFGCFTDDSQTIISVAEWILYDELTGENLLRRFVKNYEEWRRYGPSMRKIIKYFPRCKNKNSLSTLVFPTGSYGNNAVVRVVPIALRFCQNYTKLVQVTKTSAIVTHSHRLAVQGAILNAVAIMFAIHSEKDLHFDRILKPLRVSLSQFKTYLQRAEEYELSLEEIEKGLKKGVCTLEMVKVLGNDITAHKSFPIALYSFLKNSGSYEDTIRDTIYIGGDTDSISCIAGALSGAFLGIGGIPEKWTTSIKEDIYNVQYFKNMGEKIWSQE